MTETGQTRHQELKRIREEMESAEKEVNPKKKVENTWEYLELLKKLQSLETEIELVEKKLRIKETRTPDLKSLRGTVDHLVEDRFWEVQIDDKIRVLPGKSLEDATEKHRKKVQQDKKNAEKQKESAGPKKLKVQKE